MDNLTAGNPVAHRVRVYYTGSDTLEEGEGLCYSFKSTKNWFGGSVSDGAVSATNTTAEGSHNESKYICVESPMQVSLSSDTPADSSKTITGTTTDFDALQVGMFVAITGTDVTNGTYEITAISRSTETGVTNSTITLDMTAATGTTADVATTIDNLSAFAGVVAKGGWVGKAGPRVLDIYVPNGAVVPVRNDQNCTVGKTILAVSSNEQHLTAPFEAGARAVAIAWETVDTSATTGLCLAKLDSNMFIYQKGDGVRLEVDDEDTGSIMPNQIWVGTSQASGLFSALQIKGYQTAGNAESWDYGLALNVTADFAGGTITAGCTGSGHWLNLSSSVTITASAGIHALRAGIYDAGATWTSNGVVSALDMSLQIAGDPGAGKLCYFNVRNDGAHAVDGLFYAYNAAAVGLVGNTDTVNYGIPISVGGTIYYLAVTSALS